MNGLSMNRDDENPSLRMRHWPAPAFLPAERIPGAFGESKWRLWRSQLSPATLKTITSRKGAMLPAVAGAVCKPVSSISEHRIRACVRHRRKNRGAEVMQNSRVG